MSDEEFSVESLKRSEQILGKQLYPKLINQAGKVLDGVHRGEANKDWETRVIETKNRAEEILIRLHAHHRRRVSKEETRDLIIELAQELEKSGVEKERVSAELVKILPFSQGYILELLPVEYKKPEKVEAGKVSAQLTEQKEAEMLLPAIVICANCGVGTSDAKDWEGHKVCSQCHDKLSKGEITLEAPLVSRPPSEAPASPARVEKRIHTPGTFREEMRKPVPRIVQWVIEELSRRGIPMKVQEPVCIKFMIPIVTIEKGERPLGLFFDDMETQRTLVEMEDRELLHKRGFNFIAIEYNASSYTEEDRQRIISEIMSAIQ